MQCNTSLVVVIVFAEDRITQLQQRLHCGALREHIAHLPLDAAGPHDGRCEDDGKVEGSHQVLVLHAHDAAQVLAQVLETIAVVLRKIVDGAAKCKSLLFRPAAGSRVVLTVSGADIR